LHGHEIARLEISDRMLPPSINDPGIRVIAYNTGAAFLRPYINLAVSGIQSLHLADNLVV
jgi:hypothetical protein